MNRREFFKKAGFAGMLAVAVSAGLTFPKKVWAAWNEQAFKAKKTPDALNKIYGTESLTDSDKIFMKAPDIAGTVQSFLSRSKQTCLTLSRFLFWLMRTQIHWPLIIKLAKDCVRTFRSVSKWAKLQPSTLL